jgi:hypothetical protein
MDNVQNYDNYIRFGIFMAVTMTNAVFWDITPCGSCENRHFGERIAPVISVKRFGELGATLAVTSNRSTLRRNTMCEIEH